MKTIHKIAILASLLLFAFTSEAQFTTSGSSKNKKEKGQDQTQYTRQQDIQRLEQKSRAAEKEFKSGNENVLAQQKSGVLAIMNREINRTAKDLSDLNEKLASVPGGPDSQEGSALRTSIQQLQNRYNTQKRIRNNLSDLTSEELQNPKEASRIKSQYSQFIDSMKKNQKLFEGSTKPPKGGQSGSDNTTTGNYHNERYTKPANENVKVQQNLPESYYRYIDKKEREYYLKRQKNTSLELSNATKEIEDALNKNQTGVASKYVEEINERMKADIQADKKIIDRMEKGELKHFGLNGGMIMNKLSKKENIIKKVKRLQLPAHKGQLFSLVKEYIELLK